MQSKILILIAAIFLSACAQSMQTRLDNVRDAHNNGGYVAAAESFADKKPVGEQNPLELLITGEALFQAGEFKQSDDAFEEFNRRNIDLTRGSLGREAGALLGGAMANSYRPYMMDALFVSYYQIWDALADGRFDDARVIINQSYARQQGMSREYEKLIEQNQKKSSENNNLASELYAQNSQWNAFRDIMNPALTYLSGIYALNMGKFDDAKTWLRRANGMIPDNKFIRADLDAATNGTIPSDTAWVFIESGFAPKLREVRMDMPWFAGRGMIIVSIALSEPVFFSDTARIDGAQRLADVDAMFMTEYEQYRVNDALRAYSASVTRAAIQATTYNSNSGYAGLIGLASSIYSVSSTSAEIRTWATLPKNIYLLRIKKDKSGLIALKSGGNLVTEIKVSPTGNDLIYVRLGGRTPNIKQIKIK